MSKEVLSRKGAIRYSRIYELLVSCDHSPMKAVEIIMDAKRGYDFSLKWIRHVRRTRGKFSVS